LVTTALPARVGIKPELDEPFTRATTFDLALVVALPECQLRASPGALARKDTTVGVGTSLILIAVGAILEYAVHPTNTHGFDINTIGLILMIVGAIGLLVSLLFWNSWGGFSRRRVVEEGPTYRREEIV
jgi:hypothetical protein